MSTQQIIDGWEHGHEPYSETPIATDHAKRNGQATISAKLDKLFPVTCIVCDNPMQRVAPSYPICYRCGLDQTSAEAYAIQRLKPVPR